MSKEDQKKLPHISIELITWLEATYPDRCPDVDTPERQVWMDAGAAKVVRKLRAMYNKQMAKEFI